MVTVCISACCAVNDNEQIRPEKKMNANAVLKKRDVLRGFVFIG
jgi:hypothetical protein